MFVGIHALAASRGYPELAITEAEGDQFMHAAQNVMRHYSVETTQKTLDWIAFGGTVTMMYGTRLVAISVRKQAERQAGAPGRKAGRVVRFPIVQASPDGPAPPPMATDPDVILPEAPSDPFGPDAA